MAKLQEFIGKLNPFSINYDKIDMEKLKDSKEFNTLVQKESTNLLAELDKRRVGGWRSKFVSDIYKERILYPHEEMLSAKKAYLYNAWINSSADVLATFLLGGEIKVSSENKKTEEWLNDKLKTSNLGKLYQEYLFNNLVVTGNFYAERIFKEGQVFYSQVPEPERIYHELDEKQMVTGYVLELPPEQLHGSQFVTIRYYGDRRKSVKGLPIAKDKLHHIKMNQASIPSYGRGPVSVVINDFEVLLEIERAMAIIARYKAIPKKLLQMTNANSFKDTDFLRNGLNNLNDDENPIIPFEIKVDDLSYGGKELNFEPIVNYLKRKMTIAMAPSFLIHGDETTYAVSRDQRISFELKTNAIRSQIIPQMKRELRFIAKKENTIINDFEIEFGTYDIGANDEARQTAINLFNAGIITLNEAREIINLDKDQEVGDFFAFDLKSGSDSLENGEKTEGKESKNSKNPTSKGLRL